MENSFHPALDRGHLSGSHYRNASGSRLPDNQAATYDRRLRDMAAEQDMAANGFPMQRMAFQGAYDVSRYQPGGLPAFHAIYNPAAHVSVAALASRGIREQDLSQATRSAVLDEFRTNSKGNKRYELKVSSAEPCCICPAGKAWRHWAG